MTKHLLRNAPPNLVRGLNWRDLSTAKAFPGITCNSNIGFSGSGFKNERKGKVLIFSGSELACSFSPYITAVNASVVGSGPILQENKGNINRMLVKKGKGAKYFY